MIAVPVIATGTVEELEAASVIKTGSIEAGSVDGTNPVDCYRNRASRD